MKKGVMYGVFLILLAVLVSADINDKINSIVKYGEQYEMGQISYLQMIVHSNVLRHDINEMLSEKIEVHVDGPVEYGATEEEMRTIFGAPADITPWVWDVQEEKEIRIDERMPRWEKSVFDGKKLKITFNAWPNVLREDDGSLTKFYWIDFDTRFKRKFDFNTDNMISNIKDLAESFLETNEGGKELAERMVEYRNILHHYLSENRENCIKVIKEFFDDDEQVFDTDVTRWDTYIYEGDNLELTAEVTSCDSCEWPWVDIWFVVRIRDIRSKEVDMEFREFDKEKYQRYQDMAIDDLNRLIEKNVAELVKKAEQDDKSRSGNIVIDMVDVRSEIRIINRVLDEKYYMNTEELERQENYKKRMRALESIFSDYGDIDMYPLNQVLFQRKILEIIEERQDSFCRELKQDECGKDEVCLEGECINAVGGDEICDNKIDDDSDYAIDCDDPDCSLECGRACDYICSKECGRCYEEQCGDICEQECHPCNQENKDNWRMDYNPCESACQGCSECMNSQCNSQPVCDECAACHQETYQCFDTCNQCKKCEERGLGGCEKECGECDNCKATDDQRECLDFCGKLGDERADENVRKCKELCRQDVVFICPTGKQYIPCDNVHYVCDGVFIESVPCIIYECGGIKQTAPCGQEIMCGENQYADVDKCICKEGFYDCDDNKMDCEATKKCQDLMENCKDKIDNDEDGLTDCQDLLDCRIGSFCGQGPADEPKYCYKGECAFTNCGNKICDADETLYSCPPDCKFTKPVCGDEICSGNETEESCPEDCLICPPGQVLNKKGICVDEIVCPIGYINMNGTCVTPPGKCIKEGEIFDKMGKPNVLCCGGLTKLDMAWPDESIGRKDVCIATSTWEQTCTNCGDGECGLGENWCICPEDCPTPEEVPCAADADCGAGFCSQGRDVCHGVTYACLEGNCSGASTEYENFYCIDSVCMDSCGDGVCQPPEINRYCPEDCLINITCEEGFVLNKKGECVLLNITCEEWQEVSEEGLCVDICGNGRIDKGEDCESCPKDAICKTGYVCENKKCVPGIDITCPKGQVLNEEGICVKECLKEGEFTIEVKDCCTGLKAISTQVGDGRICSLTAGYVCTGLCGDGKCEGIENPCNCREDCPIPDEVNVSCTTNADCGDDTCHQGGSTCKEIQFACEEGECSAVSTEYEGYSCARYYSSDLAYPENTKCLDTCGDGICKRPENKNWCPEDCKEKELCGNSVIDPEENCESCPVDAACEEGYTCEDGECIPMLGSCPEGMEPNEVDQCVEICGNGRINEEEDCESCPKDVSCSDNFICENKECIPEEVACPEGYALSEKGACELIIKCKENQKLTDQGCIPIEDDCRQDDDCIGKEKCKAGVCVAPPKPRCEADEECPENKICSDGICVKNIETPGPPEPELTGEECILVSDCSGENDICSNGECKEIPEEFIEEEEVEEEEEEPKEEIEEVPEEEEEKPKEEKEEKKPESKKEEAKEEKPTEEPEPEPEPVQEEPEITGDSVFNVITGYMIKILGLAAEEGCKEDSDCNQNQNCDPFIGECHCKEYFFDCNGRGMGNDEDGCESEDPTCGGEREICEECNENQYCDEKKGHCICNKGFWECDGYWGNGCESDEQCKGCEDDLGCMQDVCAPWDMKHVINFGCVQGSTWEEETGAIVFGGGCNFLPTERVESYLGFNAWGESFEQVQWYQEATEQLERHWCEYQLEHLIKQRIELQESYNQEFLVWFFEEYVNSEPEKWDKLSGGIYDAYWKFVDNSRETNRQLRCLNLNKFPSEYELVGEIEYESEYGYVKFWEEKAVLDAVEIFSPYMQIWVFPPKEFVKENLRTAMEEGIMPGPPREEELGLTPAEIKEAKLDEEFMEKITDICDEFGGSADFLIIINDGDEILYKAILTINPDTIFTIQVKDIEDIEPDVTINVDFEFFYEIVENTEKEVELEKPPWDEKQRMREKIKGAIDKGKIIAKVTRAIATGKIKVSPISQVGKVTRVMGFMFDQGPKDKGPKDDERGEEKKD